METENKATGFFSQFPKIFWIVNALELFERGAYYGTMAVLPFHVYYTLFADMDNIGAVYGSIYALLIFLLYFMPMVSAALAEKYGYKSILLLAFITLVIGYFLLFTVRPGQLSYFIFALVFVGIGAGAFKPIISASIAHVTAEEQRNVAYSIYYWMINLGAAVLPFFIGWKLGTLEMFYFVFIVSSVLISVNLVITIFLYINPVKPQKELSVPNAMKRIIPALKDRKFVLLLATYSGFWFMFSLNHSYLGWYMGDFQRMPTWFPYPWLAVFNPATIIIAGPFLAKLVEKQKSLNMVMLGILIFCLGLAIVGFSNSPALFVGGILIFSVGEFITHPGFIAHVSKIAPKNMVAIYMASIFISTGSGNMIGGLIGGVWYDKIVIGMHMPKLFFAAVIAVGLFTFICFVFYRRWENDRSLRFDPKAIIDTGLFTRPIAMVIVALLMVAVIAGAMAAGTDSFIGRSFDGTDEEFTWADFDTGSGSVSESGFTEEGDGTEVNMNIDQVNLAWVYVNLTWTDEPDDRGRNNQPDTFSIEVETPGGEKFESIQYSQGPISIPIKLAPDNDGEDNATGFYKIIVNCHDAGNQEPIVGGQFGVLENPDDGNNWNLMIEYSYYESK